MSLLEETSRRFRTAPQFAVPQFTKSETAARPTAAIGCTTGDELMEYGLFDGIPCCRALHKARWPPAEWPTTATLFRSSASLKPHTVCSSERQLSASTPSPTSLNVPGTRPSPGGSVYDEDARRYSRLTTAKPLPWRSSARGTILEPLLVLRRY